MATGEDLPDVLHDQTQPSDEQEDVNFACTLCYDLQNNDLSPLSDKHKTTPRALSNSATQGCQSCGILLGALECYMDPEEEPDVEVILQCELSGYLPYSSSGQYIKIRSRPLEFDIQVYTTDARVTQCWPLISLGSHVSEDSSSEECFTKAKTWIEECDENHGEQNCLSATNGRLPTRVIDVGTSTRQPRVHISAQDQTGIWAALSYRWGLEGHQKLMLTSNALDQLTKGFDVDHLPQTCRDAVVAARGLGIQYLWIDALCILQDSREDWEKESSAMCHIYRDALVTIAAVDSASAETGLFRPLIERQYRKLDRKRTAIAPSEHIFARPTEFFNWGDRFRHGPSPERHMVADGLNTRAWTFQETLLSPRILWFTAYELVWTCCSGTACECSCSMKKSSLVTNRASDKSLSWREPTLNLYLRTKFSFPEKTDWSSQWLDLVETYTERTLTYPTDRLPALSGIATLLAEHIGGSYYAGIWEVVLFNQLMWTAHRHPKYEELSDTSELIREHYAPSWSWASAGRGAQISTWRTYTSIHPESPSIWQCEIQSTSFRPSQSNIFGPGRGQISARSKVFALAFEEIKRILMTHFMYGIRREYSMHFQFVPSDPRLRSFGSIEITFDPRDYFRWDPDKVEMHADIFFVAVRMFREDKPTETFDRNVGTCFGLACVRVADSGSFRRVGYCHFDVDGDEKRNAWQSLETTTIRLV